MEGDESQIRHRQEVFNETVKSHFLFKIQRYRKLLLKDGVNVDIETSQTNLHHRTMSVEEQLQLVVGHSRPSSAASLKRNFQKAGKRLSAVSLFRWLYRVVQRNKAATILQHLDRVPEDDMISTVEGVAKEISVAYEYQLAMLYGEGEVIRLGQHAVACMMLYLNNRDASFAAEGLLTAILEVKLPSNQHKDILRTRTLMYQGQQLCLRWRLGQVLKQPGLRVIAKDLLVDGSVDKTLPSGPEAEPALVTKGKSSEPSINSDLQYKSSPIIASCLKSSEIDTCSGDVEDSCIGITATVGSGQLLGQGDSQDTKHHSEKFDSDSRKLDGVASDKHTITTEQNCVQRENSILDSSNIDTQTSGTVTTRKISAFDMDYENDLIFVTEVEISGKCASPDDVASDNNTDRETTTDETADNDELDNMVTMQANNAQRNCITKMSGQIKHTNIAKGNFQLLGKDGQVHSCGIGMTDSSYFDSFGAVLNDDSYTTYPMCRPQSGSSSATSSCGMKTNTCNLSLSSRSSTSLSSSVVRDCSDTLEQASRCSGENEETIESKRNDMKQDDTDDFTKPTTATNVHEMPLRSQHFVTRQKDESEQRPGDSCLEDATQIHEGSRVSNECDVNKATGKEQIQLDEQNSSNASTTPQQSHPGYLYFGCFTPYGARCRPQQYGFRGPLHVWDEVKQQYTLIYNDRVSVLTSHRREISRRPHCPHQHYHPVSQCEH